MTHRQLHQDAVHVLIGVERLHQAEHLLLRCCCWQLGAEERNAHLLASQALHVHVGLRVLALAHNDHCQARFLFMWVGKWCTSVSADESHHLLHWHTHP